MSSFSNSVGPGLYIAPTDFWGGTVEERTRELYQNYNNVANAVNLKETGYYPLTEFVNSQLFFPNPNTTGQNQSEVYRNVFRKVINFGALPDNTSKSVAHGIDINGNTSFTRIYGTANDMSSNTYKPIPYASGTAADNIEMEVDATNVIITTGTNLTSFDTCYVVLEYLKN